MNYKTTLRILSLLFIILGILFFSSGPGLLCYFGLDMSAEMVCPNYQKLNFWKVFSFTRLFGTAIFMYGIIIGFLAYISGDKNRRYVTFGGAIGLLFMIVITLIQQIAIWETIAGWILLLIFILSFISLAMLSLNKKEI